MSHNFITHLSVGGELGGYHFDSIVTTAGMEMDEQVPQKWDMESFSFCLGGRQFGSICTCFKNFLTDCIVGT